MNYNLGFLFKSNIDVKIEKRKAAFVLEITNINMYNYLNIIIPNSFNNAKIIGYSA